MGMDDMVAILTAEGIDARTIEGKELQGGKGIDLYAQVPVDIIIKTFAVKTGNFVFELVIAGIL
jgi:hypothetical protein